MLMPYHLELPPPQLDLLSACQTVLDLRKEAIQSQYCLAAGHSPLLKHPDQIPPIALLLFHADE
jgi:hypothetical protein